MEPDSEGLRELKKEVFMLLAEMIEEIIQNGDFVEKLDDINQRMYERYGCVITDMVTSFVAKTSKVEATNENQAILKPSAFPVEISIEDKEFLSAFKIDSQEKELNELRKDLNEARKENPQAISANDPRTNDQILDDIGVAVRKLDPNLRLATAKRININLGTHIPVAEQSILLNDTFWLQQIQAAINRICELAGADDKIKSLLLSLEIIVRSGGYET